MTDKEVGEAKRAWRADFTRRRAAQPRWLAARRSRAIGQRVGRLSAWRDAGLILGYMAIRGEVDPAALLRRALQAGKIVALPRVGAGRSLTFHRWTGQVDELRPGAFGIPEPVADPGTRVDPAAAGLVLVPGVAFSVTGGRLGYGGGFYDTLLGRLGDGVPLVGLAYEFQLTAELPRARHDHGVRAVVTERRVRFT